MARRRLWAIAPSKGTSGPEVAAEASLASAAGRCATTIAHPVGTARMGGPQDEGAVVGPDLAVRNVPNLSVAGASVMPRIVSGGTHAPTVMIAERAAELPAAKG